MKRLQENICRVLLMNSNLQTNYNGGLERHRDGPFLLEKYVSICSPPVDEVLKMVACTVNSSAVVLRIVKSKGNATCSRANPRPYGVLPNRQREARVSRQSRCAAC